MVAKVEHPELQFAYRCEHPGCDAPPFRWRDQAEDCERWHRQQQDKPATRKK